MIIGIDPGLSGAIAILDNFGGFIAVHDLPVQRDKSLAWINGVELRSIIGLAGDSRHETRVVIERVSSMPGQGIASSFQFGVGFGSILSIVQSLHVSLELVTPATWKRDMGLTKAKGESKPDKKAALHKARLLFPTAELHLAKHDGRAEALLIAKWYADKRGALHG